MTKLGSVLAQAAALASAPLLRVKGAKAKDVAFEITRCKWPGCSRRAEHQVGAGRGHNGCRFEESWHLCSSHQVGVSQIRHGRLNLNEKWYRERREHVDDLDRIFIDRWVGSSGAQQVLLSELLERAAKHLTFRERDIIGKRHCVFGFALSARTLESVARDWKVTRERARQLEVHGIRKMQRALLSWSGDIETDESAPWSHWPNGRAAPLSRGRGRA